MKKDEKTAVVSLSACPQSQENHPESTASDSTAAWNDGAVTVGGGRSRIHCLTVIGQIEGHYQLGGGQKTTQYEHLIPDLVAAAEDDTVSGLLMILNTVGGDV